MSRVAIVSFSLLCFLFFVFSPHLEAEAVIACGSITNQTLCGYQPTCSWASSLCTNLTTNCTLRTAGNCEIGTLCILAKLTTNNNTECVTRQGIGALLERCDQFTLDLLPTGNLETFIETCSSDEFCEYTPITKRCIPKRTSTCRTFTAENDCVRVDGCTWVSALSANKCRPKQFSLSVPCYTFDGNEEGCLTSGSPDGLGGYTTNKCTYDGTYCLDSATSEPYTPGLLEFCRRNEASVSKSEYTRSETVGSAAVIIRDACNTKVYNGHSDVCEYNYVQKAGYNVSLCYPSRHYHGCTRVPRADCLKLSFCYYNFTDSKCVARTNGTDAYNLRFSPIIKRVEGIPKNDGTGIHTVDFEIITPLESENRFLATITNFDNYGLRSYHGFLVADNSAVYSSFSTDPYCNSWRNPNNGSFVVPNPNNMFTNSAFWGYNHTAYSIILQGLLTTHTSSPTQDTEDDVSDLLTETLVANSVLFGFDGRTHRAKLFEGSNVLYTLSLNVSHVLTRCTTHAKRHKHTVAHFHDLLKLNITYMRIASAGEDAVVSSPYSWSTSIAMDTLGFVTSSHALQIDMAQFDDLEHSETRDYAVLTSGPSPSAVFTTRHEVSTAACTVEGTAKWITDLMVVTYIHGSLLKQNETVIFTGLNTGAGAAAVKFYVNKRSRTLNATDCDSDDDFTFSNMRFEGCSKGSNACFSKLTVSTKCLAISTVNAGRNTFGKCTRGLGSAERRPVKLSLSMTSCSFFPGRYTSKNTASIWHKKVESGIDHEYYMKNCSASTGALNIFLSFGAKVASLPDNGSVVEDLSFITGLGYEDTILPLSFALIQDINLLKSLPQRQVIPLRAETAFSERRDFDDVYLGSMLDNGETRSYNEGLVVTPLKPVYKLVPHPDTEQLPTLELSHYIASGLRVDLTKTTDEFLCETKNVSDIEKILTLASGSSEDTLIQALKSWDLRLNLNLNLKDTERRLDDDLLVPVDPTNPSETTSTLTNAHIVSLNRLSSPHTIGEALHYSTGVGVLGRYEREDAARHYLSKTLPENWVNLFHTDISEKTPGINDLICLWKTILDRDQRVNFTGRHQDLSEKIILQILEVFPKALSYQVDENGLLLFRDVVVGSNVDTSEFLPRIWENDAEEWVGGDDLWLNTTVFITALNYMYRPFIGNSSFMNRLRMEIGFTSRHRIANPAILDTEETQTISDLSGHTSHKRISTMFIEDSAKSKTFILEEHILARLKDRTGDLNFTFSFLADAPAEPAKPISEDKVSKSDLVVMIIPVIGSIVLLVAIIICCSRSKYRTYSPLGSRPNE